MSDYSDYRPGGLYRSRRGIIFGVCRGLADRFDLSAFWLRVITIATFILTGFFPVGVVYILMALLMKPEPRWRSHDYA